MHQIQDLEALITQQSLPENPKTDEPSCPHCSHTNVQILSTGSTLMGSGNHITQKAKCLDCQLDFHRHQKSGNVWYTQQYKVLKGLPNCFETYILTCNTCHNDVHREYLKLHSDEPTNVSRTNVNGTWVKNYRILYACDNCKWEMQTEQDYWHHLSKEGSWP